MNRRSLSSLVLVLFVAGSSACSPPEAPVVDPAVVAQYDGGEILLAEVEEELRGRTASKATSTEDWLALYRTTAHDLLVRRLAMAASDDEELALAPALARKLDDAHRAALRGQLVSTIQLPKAEPITQAQLRSVYEERHELFLRPEQRNVWHLFRRQRTGESPQEAHRALTELASGPSSPAEFRSLAGKHSDSETRALDGRLGWLGRGRLPPKLEAVVFSLAEGTVSEPLAVPGGWTVFFVSDALPARQFSFEDVSVALRVLQSNARRRENLTRELDLPEPLEGSILSPSTALLTAILGRAPTAILEIGNHTITGAQLADRFDAQTPPLVSLPAQLRVEDLYAGEKFAALLDLEIEHRGMVDDTELMREIETNLLPLRTSLRAENQIQQWLEERAASSPDLERFFADNRFLYQTEPAMRVRVWSLPLPVGSSSSTAALAGRVANRRDQLELANDALNKLATEIGGKVDDLGWIQGDTLMTLTPKVRHYLTKLSGVGLTDLHIAQVTTIKEPVEQPFEEVRDQVLADFLQRSKQDLYADLVGELTTENHFRFLEDHVARVLEAPEPADPLSP